jgi:hypothetical protein
VLTSTWISSADDVASGVLAIASVEITDGAAAGGSRRRCVTFCRSRYCCCRLACAHAPSNDAW